MNTYIKKLVIHIRGKAFSFPQEGSTCKSMLKSLLSRHKKPKQLNKQWYLKILYCIIPLCVIYCTSLRPCFMSLTSARYCIIVRTWEFDVRFEIVADCCTSNIADEETNYQRVWFHDCGTFWYVVLRIQSRDTGWRARTKQFIEFALKISFTPCNFLKNTYKLLHIELSNSNNYAVRCRSHSDTTQPQSSAIDNAQRYYAIKNFKIS